MITMAIERKDTSAMPPSIPYASIITPPMNGDTILLTLDRDPDTPKTVPRDDTGTILVILEVIQVFWIPMVKIVGTSNTNTSQKFSNTPNPMLDILRIKRETCIKSDSLCSKRIRYQ